MAEQKHAKHKSVLCPDNWTFDEKVYHHGEGLCLSREDIDEQLDELRMYEFNRGYLYWDLVASRWLTRHVQRQASREMSVTFPSARSQSASERTASTLRLIAKGGKH